MVNKQRSSAKPVRFAWWKNVSPTVTRRHNRNGIKRLNCLTVYIHVKEDT